MYHLTVTGRLERHTQTRINTHTQTWDTQTPNRRLAPPYRAVTSPSTTNTRQEEQEKAQQGKTHPPEDVEVTARLLTHTHTKEHTDRTDRRSVCPAVVVLQTGEARGKRENQFEGELDGGEMSSRREGRGERGRGAAKRSSRVRRPARLYT